ncbi:MAG: hypothetical protein V2A56_13775, partial [bacterium]
MKPGILKIRAERPSSALFTPQALRYAAGWGIYEPSTELTGGGTPRSLSLLDTNGLPVEFRFEDGESMGVPVSGDEHSAARLLMVDAEGWSVTNEPAYYDLYPGNGELYRFCASATASNYFQQVLYKSASGRQETMSDSGVEVVMSQDRVLQQVLSASCLADIVVENSSRYSIRFYQRADVQSQRDENGRFVPSSNATPYVTWVVENPETNSINRLLLTRQLPGGSNVYDFVYVDASEEWTLTTGNGLKTVAKDAMWDDDHENRLVTEIIRSDMGEMALKKTTLYHVFPWGERQTDETLDPDAAALKTKFLYYEDSSQQGRYSKMSGIQYADGSWERYDYDANGVQTGTITPWKDSAYDTPAGGADVVYHDYTPVDAGDVLAANDQRPRTVTRKIMGVTVAKTFHAYVTTASKEFLEIEEKCVNPEADYGDPDNLQTIKTYYGTNASDVAVGLLKSIQQPDGRLDTYSYEYGNYIEQTEPGECSFQPDSGGSALRTTIIHGTTNSPDGIAYKTTKETKVLDPFSNEVLTETYVYTGGSNYERVEWMVKSFDVFGHAMTETKSTGEKTESSWGGCCGKENETDAQGIQKVYEYDALSRVIAEIKVGTNSPADDVEMTYKYDAVGRRLGQSVSGGDLTLVTSNEYNLAGQLRKTVDAVGLITTYSYNNGGGVRSRVLPSGAMEITENYLDGRIKSITGTGVISRYYEYGVDANGFQWTLVYIGPEGTNSPMWEKNTTDLLGRIVKTEKPGFGGTQTVEYTYNAKGQLTKVESTGQADTLYEYDELGNQTRSGLDVNGNGVLNLASTDRIQETDSRYVESGSNWWQEVEQRVYAAENDDDPTTVNIQRKAFGSGCACQAQESVVIDIHGNQTVATTAIDRDAKKVTRTTVFPDSTNAAVEIAI